MRNTWIERLSQHERINFLVTNRLPRRWVTQLMGWLSRIEHPLVFRPAFAVWRRFGGDFRLDEARKQSFTSLHDCFTRELKDGVRPIAAGHEVLVSPCDAVIGALGRIAGTQVFQAKGFPYTLEDLFGGDAELAARYRDGLFVTLRLKSNMYHRFHAPCDCRLDEVLYISGDTWNVNPIALRRVERLFCKNERAVLDLDIDDSNRSLALVAVAAILVASMRFKCLAEPLRLSYAGPNRLRSGHRFAKGEEIGHFEHGSTIIVFASGGFEVCRDVAEEATIRMGEPLLRKV